MSKLEMRKYVTDSMSFSSYQELIEKLVADGRTTGPNQSEKMAEYTRLNRQRMLRLEKTVEIESELREALRDVDRRMIWLIITEAWCGDAAQNIPVIERIARESDLIETRYTLRDENLELIDNFLTNGARSIPKLIALDADAFEVLGTWGARPAVAQELYAARKDQGLEKAAITEELQRWYNADQGRSLQREFAGMVGIWENQIPHPLSGAPPPAGRAMTTADALN